MTYLTCKLRFSSILARFIAKQLSFEKKHKSLLWQIARIVKVLNNRLSLFNGLKLYVTGKLIGKMRRQAYSFKLGKLPLQKIESNLDFCKTTSFTKFGTISVKLWLVF
jgi:ribosomal protein S3